MNTKELKKAFDNMILSYKEIKPNATNKELIMFISKDIIYNNKKYKGISVKVSNLTSEESIYLVNKNSIYFE